MSPFRRALQTTFLLFKNHPNFKNIEVILDPDLRDELHASFHIPNPIIPLIEEFDRLFPNLNVQYLDLNSEEKDLWFLENTDVMRKNYLKNYIYKLKDA